MEKVNFRCCLCSVLICPIHLWFPYQVLQGPHSRDGCQGWYGLSYGTHGTLFFGRHWSEPRGERVVRDSSKLPAYPTVFLGRKGAGGFGHLHLHCFESCREVGYPSFCFDDSYRMVIHLLLVPSYSFWDLHSFFFRQFSLNTWNCLLRISKSLSQLWEGAEKKDEAFLTNLEVLEYPMKHSEYVEVAKQEKDS